MKRFLKYWWFAALIIIILMSYGIRAYNIVPDRLLSFDPIFEYRFTKYLADFGVLPIWDELSYYTGRPVLESGILPFMFYLTVLLFAVLKNFGMSVMTTSAYASAIYGALIVVPAFLLGRELSNNYGGLLSALLIGTAPQILVRTFGSSYDTDQIVLFFILFTLFAGYLALKKRTPATFCIAVIGFAAFMLSWSLYAYTLIILFAYVVLCILLAAFFYRKENIKPKFFERVKAVLPKFWKWFAILAGIFISIFIIGLVNATTVSYKAIIQIIGFAQKAEAWIVNISIAELQPFSIFNLDGWRLAMGRFVTGDFWIDLIVFLGMMGFMAFGLWHTWKKKDAGVFAFLLTLFLMAIYTTFRGVRFAEFSSALFIILVGAGFGCLMEHMRDNNFYRSIAAGVCLFIALTAIGLGMQIGQYLGPDINSNWENAWNFLKMQTPELSIVGTWWDPGHMIAGLAERRNFADGAHCTLPCKYNINDRITDLGKIMATNNESESLALIRKYQGNSPKVYWIASEDLIGKFQWLQYFGTGCDARTEARCPLYMQVPQQSAATTQAGEVTIRYYPFYNAQVALLEGPTPIPVFVQGRNAALFLETIFYDPSGVVQTIKLSEDDVAQTVQMLKPLEKQLNARFVNQTIALSVWIPKHKQFVVLIPETLRNTVFTRMFMLEGKGLEYFRQVFRNEEVKIYEVLI